MKSPSSISFWRHPDLPGVEFAQVRARTHTYPKHTHERFAVGVMRHGASYCMDGADDAALVTVGRIALINPGQVHTCNPPRGVRPSYQMFYLDAAWLNALASENDGPQGNVEFARLVVDVPPARRLLAGIVPDEQAAPATEARLVAAFTRLMTRHAARPARSTKPGHETRRVELVREHLRAHLDRRVTLAELATLTGLSRYHLLRVFRRATGLPPHGWHLQQRVDAARTLLRQGRGIADTAAATGFTDQSHLTTTFRRYVGVTPGCYVRGS